MTTKRPNVEPEALYNQRQAADALRVNRHTIRKYEALGLITFRSRAPRARVTTGAEILRCWGGEWGFD